MGKRDQKNSEFGTPTFFFPNFNTTCEPLRRSLQSIRSWTLFHFRQDPPGLAFEEDAFQTYLIFARFTWLRACQVFHHSEVKIVRPDDTWGLWICCFKAISAWLPSRFSCPIESNSLPQFQKLRFKRAAQISRVSVKNVDCSEFSPQLVHAILWRVWIMSSFQPFPLQSVDQFIRCPARITAITSAGQVTYSRERPSTKRPRWGNSYTDSRWWKFPLQTLMTTKDPSCLYSESFKVRSQKIVHLFPVDLRLSWGWSLVHQYNTRQMHNDGCGKDCKRGGQRKAAHSLFFWLPREL